MCGAVYLDNKLGKGLGYCIISWVPVWAFASIVKKCSMPETRDLRTAARDFRGSRRRATNTDWGIVSKCCYVRTF